MVSIIYQLLHPYPLGLHARLIWTEYSILRAFSSAALTSNAFCRRPTLCCKDKYLRTYDSVSNLFLRSGQLSRQYSACNGWVGGRRVEFLGGVGGLQRSQIAGYSVRSDRASNTACTDKVSSSGAEKSTETFLQYIYRIKSNLERDKILTVPNVLTLMRMIASPILGYLVLQESYHMACGVFIVAGFTDLLDGFIARNFANQTSALGSFMDPLADKLLVSILFLSLTAVNLIPLSLTALVIVRDICLTTGGFYVRYISLNPRPTTLGQFFDLTNRSAELQPTTISKVNTAVQLSLVAFTLGAPVFNYIDHPALQALWYLTACTTVISGIGYIFAKDTFKLLKQSRKKEV